MSLPIPAEPRTIAWPSRLAPVATGLVYFAAAMVALWLTQGTDGVATIWTASGILVSALVLDRWERRHLHLAAAGMASLAANLLAHNGWAMSLGFTAANLVEAAFIVRLVRGRTGSVPSFADVRQIGRFSAIAVAGTATSASLATLVYRAPDLFFWSSWFTTDLLGVLVVTPVVLTAWPVLADPAERRARTLAVALDIVAVAIVSVAAFAQSGLPLLFVPFAAVMIATLRGGPLGAATSVTIVTIAGSLFTHSGMGPLSLDYRASPVAVLVFQGYLLVLLGTALSLAALLASRDQLLKRLGESNRLLNVAERNSGVGHWRFEARTGLVTYSPALVALYGLASADPIDAEEAMAMLHVEDRDEVERLLGEAMRGGPPFDFTVRVRRADGAERLVRSRGTADIGVDGASLGVIGTAQDITEGWLAELGLIEARLRAEAAAERARIDAETDPLTGAPNRRKAMALLLAASEARSGGRPLSVAMIDIDRFKAVNDRHGHAVGDLVLTAVFRQIRDNLRGSDHVARFGGEEFLAILPGSSSEQARGVLERVRESVAGGGDAAIPSVTISAGIATWEPGETLEQLLARADHALYAAKGSGRNRLKLAA